ncbi:signal transducing adaptor molecule [Blastomyces dermatitidis ER-3]|uniref:Signal transducing adaptor molecule n=1 Tax=Ajellomyces dermatitidis (strain ER-3 / ATCC MYA-2586) TaxID=559297 RepID=A0ABP2F814_AJEDR|nr:signal transducing adaptor molecule [Blastomyces dermatitidis ER-3]EEQ92706.1 signal transducing adaptor molecule [Blastomyces dermatitidis ER-3]
MFRAQQNAFDDAVAKATDENLTSENWEFILRQITDFDRQKEEEELQMALALSIKDKSSSSSTQNNTAAQRTTSQDSQGQPAPSQLLPSGTTAATVSRVRALYDFQPSEPGELQFRKGDVIAVLESVYKDWWKGSLRGQTGIFPLNYVEKLSDPTQEELQREAQMEAEVFAEIKNVEKLLTLLSTNDFTQLNEKFIKARRDYESLLEASMAHPSQPHYGRPPQSAYSYPVQSASPGYPQGVQQDEAHHYYAAHPQDGPKPFQSSQTPFYSSEQVPLPYPNNVQTPDTRQRTPSGTRPLQQSQQQPPSDTYGANGLVHNHAQNSSDHPQELGTSVYDSPQDSVPPNIRHSYHSPSHQPSHQVQPQPADFSSLPYSPVGNPQSQTPSLNQPYTAQSHPPQHIQQHQQLATSAPSQPHQAPPSVPSSSPGQPPYPTAPAAARPGPGSGSYQSYHPPSGPQATSSNVNLNPSSFYR